MAKDYTTRQTLLMRARNQQDNDAWEEFISVYKHFICHVLQQMKMSVVEIDDLSQEVLIKLWKKLSLYDPQKARFRSWLSSVIRNIVIDYIRANTSRSQREDKKLSDSAAETSSEPEIILMIEQEWKAHISEMALNNIKKLFSDKAFQVFKLSLQDKTVDEICQQVDIKKDSVKVLKSRVRARYLEELKRLIREFEEC